MKFTTKLLTAICVTGLSATTAQAQMNAPFTETDNIQARATFTIPFGGDHKKADAKPQFALAIRSETAKTNLSDWALRPASEAFEVREFKLALTIEDTPTFLMNDQPILFGDKLSAGAGENADKKGGLDTYDKGVLTVIGVSLAVIAGSIIILSDS